MFSDWYIIIYDSLERFLEGFVGFIPVLIGAIIVLGVGWIIAIAIGKLVTEVLKQIKFNRLFDRGVWKESLEKADFKIDASGFIGAIVKWVLVIVFLQISIAMTGWVQFASILEGIINYLPNVIIAALIFVVAVVIADILEKLVRVVVERTKIGYGNVAGIIVKWSIWIFAILAILKQLLIAPELVQSLTNAFIYGTMLFIVIAGGIAFGIGGKESAGNIIRGIEGKLRR